MMVELNGASLNNFPLKDFNRVADLIYFDGPLLVHYTNHKGHHYLYHWVDSDDTANRWLIYRVTQQNLLNYLRGLEEFKALLETTISEWVLVADINDEGQHTLLQLLSLEDLPEDYIPEENIYYELSFPEYYNTWIEQPIVNSPDSSQGHYEALQNKAIYTNLKPSGNKHGTSPEVPQMVDYLKNINISFVEYAHVNYEKRFASRSNDTKQWNKSIRNIREQAVLRGVDFGLGSFGVALAPDFISSLSVLDQESYNWLKDLPSRFQTEVIDMDFTNPESIDTLSNSYTSDQLIRFLNPYLKIIENEDYQITKADKHFKSIDKPVRSNEKVREVLFEKVNKNDILILDNPEKELVTIVFEKNKDQEISKMTRKQIVSKIVSAKQVNEYTIEINSIEWRGKGYKLRNPLELKATFSGQQYKVREDTTGIEGDGSTSEEAVNKLKERMLRRYDLLKGMIADFRTDEQNSDFDRLKQIVLDEQV
ncbi:DUF6575 domain-containing protein [Hymenobacter sp. GOD-10R]|uniref:DUF6575 domain-containing protein n=1 Tax=Hymenobacter sp. GOD-10R TaxID=3093922 RepID=UPI002D78F3B9|nr:DUF6575 domain-containing protein [Hymenobacter sp. GOD-10R]WRQ29372.1 DUF6575 domain-containing protein [Hymenobacter sp. GOD-10R]